MEVMPGYKKTDVGVIPADWDAGGLGRFWSVTDCKHVTAEFLPDGLPVASIREVQSRFVDLRHAKQTTAHFYEMLIEGGRKPRPGDLILSRNATVGEVAQVTELHPPFAMGQDVCLLRKKSGDHSTEFLQALFESPVVLNQFANLMVGSTFKRANVEQIRNLAVPMPPPPEQRAIATALSDADALLTGLDRLIAKKRDLKQAAMQQLLTGQTRLPGFQGEWVATTLGKIAKIQRGASPRPIDSPIWFDENSHVGWVRISDVTRSGMFLDETTQRLSALGVEHSRPVTGGSLIMSICATVGRPVITRIDVCIHDGFVVFDQLDADQRYLYYVLKWIEPTWSKRGQTGSQMNLNTGLINGAEVLLPSVEEQTAIATILTDIDAELTALEARRKKTHALKQGMMQELLTGRTRLV
jgi:type I restriction enzyme, S subunit